MPILWRFLLGQYLRVFFLCTISFISILLVMRLEEIAHFATLGASFWTILTFIAYQIPYILPIAIPIASLISAILLFQGLSKTFEISAFRSCGISLFGILSPILAAAAFFSLSSFYITSEMSTHSHLSSSLLKTELRSINPLLILHNKHFMNVKGFYYDVMGASRLGESASDIMLSMPNKSNSRLNLMIARELQTEMPIFTAKDVTILSSMSGDNDEAHDHLLIENISHATTSTQDFLEMVHKKVATVNNDHLSLPLLLIRMDNQKQAISEAQARGVEPGVLKQMQRHLNKGYSEIVRRISLALAVFSFTLMGAAFGLSIGRQTTQRGIYFIVGLAGTYLIAFFVAKAMEHVVTTAAALYLLPHLLIIVLSLWALKRTVNGVE